MLTSVTHTQNSANFVEIQSVFFSGEKSVAKMITCYQEQFQCAIQFQEFWF